MQELKIEVHRFIANDDYAAKVAFGGDGGECLISPAWLRDQYPSFDQLKADGEVNADGSVTIGYAVEVDDEIRQLVYKNGTENTYIDSEVERAGMSGFEEVDVYEIRVTESMHNEAKRAVWNALRGSAAIRNRGDADVLEEAILAWYWNPDREECARMLDAIEYTVANDRGAIGEADVSAWEEATGYSGAD